MSRPSHQLPRPIFDAIETLEHTVEKHAAHLATHDVNHAPDGGRSYLNLVMATGAARDELASLILSAISEAKR
jgi:hypothetical protein